MRKFGKGRCPQCDRMVSSISAFSARLDASLAARGVGAVFYVCPFCAAVLGSSVDPVGVADSAIEMLLKRLGGGH